MLPTMATPTYILYLIIFVFPTVNYNFDLIMWLINSNNIHL